MKILFVLIQHITPQLLLSRIAGALAECRIKWIKNIFINQFINAYGVNMSEAIASQAEDYACFNDFFCRSLKPGVRQFDDKAQSLASPVDGCFSQLGKIDSGTIFQAKGRSFSTYSLLGGNKELGQYFSQGEFATIYLSPKDYHRLHMPIAGRLLSMQHIPGRLFSVNPTTVEGVEELFARNERVVCVFETAIGQVALVLVGAMIVASVETVWHGLVERSPTFPAQFSYHDQELNFEKGEEFARFKLGSTIVMLFPENTVEWLDEYGPEKRVQLGNVIADINLPS